MKTTLEELKKYLKNKDINTSGKKDELVKKFKKAYKISDKIDDPILYLKIREKIKKKVKTWPSAYASGLVVQEYKKAGGSYSGDKEGKLDRWYKEKWINVCERDSKVRFLPCSSKDSKRYPYCRPSIKVTKNTPKTVKEISTKKKKEMCQKKKGSKRVYLKK